MWSLVDVHSWEAGTLSERQEKHLRSETATEVSVGMTQYTSLLVVSPEPPGPSSVSGKAIRSQRQSWIKYKYGNYFQTHFSKSRFLSLDVTGYANDGEEAHQAVPVALLAAHCGRSCHGAFSGSQATGPAKARKGSLRKG